MTSIHDRMPVLFQKEKITDWLSPDIDPSLTIRHALRDLVVETTAS